MNFRCTFNLQKILQEIDYSKRKTKIICTIGPSSSDLETICKMLDAGMNVARINILHSEKDFYENIINNLRKAFKLKKHLQCSIMLDTRGPEVITSYLKNGQPIKLKQGQLLEILGDNEEYEGDNKVIGCSINLSQCVKIGQQILMQQGSISCHVIEIKEESVIVQIDNDSILNSQTRIRLPGCNLNLPTISEQDEEDIINYGVEKGIDYISVSFCTSAQDIEQIKDLISPRGDNIKIIAKIENLLGLENFEEILQASDGIMIARGDLGMEIPTQKVFVAQKWIIERCLEVGKPVITATQMMESMIQYPRPTRAEASDVANAILDGTDAVLLSSETSKGKYPVECIQIISKLVSEAEMCYNNAQNFFHRTKIVREISDRESMATSAVQMSFDLKANTIVIFSMYGDMARMVCKYRPKAHIIVVSNMAGTIKGLAISCGIVCLKVPSFQGIDQIINYAIQRAKELNFCQKNEKVIVIMGSEEDDQDQSDILKVKVVT